MLSRVHRASRRARPEGSIQPFGGRLVAGRIRETELYQEQEESEKGYLAELLGWRRGRQPRIAVRWWVDVQVPRTGHYVGFVTRDISLPGVRLVGNTCEAFKRVLSEDGQARMRLRVPGHPQVFPVRAEFKWGIREAGDFLTGWRFTGMARQVRRALRAYIQAHPEAAVYGPG